MIDEARASLVEWAAKPGWPLFEQSEDSYPERAVDVVLDWCREWEKPHSSPDTLAIFAPSLHRRRQLEAQVVDPDDLQGRGPRYDRWLLEIVHLSLFVDQIWVPDPAEIVARALDHVITPRLAVHDFLADSWEAREALIAIAPLQPLVKAGVVRYYPALTLYETVVSQELFGVHRDFDADELATAWPKGFVAEGLVYAEALDATYTGLAREEFDALRGAARELSERVGLTDAKVVAALPSLRLPYFEKMSPETLVAVRGNESAFEDFRKMLREVLALLPAGAESPQFDGEVRRIEKDALNPAIKKLLDDVRGVATMRECLSSAGIEFAAGALAGVVLTGNPLVTLPAGAISVLSQTVLKLMFKRPKVRPAGSIALSFHTGRAPRTGLLSSIGVRPPRYRTG